MWVGREKEEDRSERRNGKAILGVPVAQECPCEQRETRARAFGCQATKSVKNTSSKREHMRAA